MAKTSKKAVTKMAQISELELAAYLTMKEQYEQAKKEAAKLEKTLKGQTESLIARLRAGEEVVGGFEAVVVQEEGSCRPAWKDEYLTHMEQHGVARDLAEAQVQQRTEVPVKDVLKVAPRLGK
jgi:hypothetical protein